MDLAGFLVANVYVQATLATGYRVLDRRGALAEHWKQDLPTAEFTGVSVALKRADGVLREVRANVDHVWCHFREPDSLTYVGDHAWKVVEAASELVEEGDFTSFGFRMECLRGIANVMAAATDVRHALYSDAINQWVEHGAPSDKILFDSVLRWVANDGLLVAVQHRMVHLADPPESGSRLPRQAVMLDCDLRRQGAFKTAELRSFLREAERWTHERFTELATTTATSEA